MKDSELLNHAKIELWVERVEDTIDTLQDLQGIFIPQDIRDGIVKFMRGKIKIGIEKKKLAKTMLQVAVSALVHIKMRTRK